MVGALLLAGLPEEYKPMIMALENSGIPITGDSVKVKLLQDVKLTEKAAGEDTALYSKAKSHKNKYNDPKKCFNCDKVGHFASRCRSKPKTKDTQKRQQEKTHYALNTSKGTNSNKWHIDSCASAHMTGNKKCLRDICEGDERKVTAANNEQLTAREYGGCVSKLLPALQTRRHKSTLPTAFQFQ